MTTGTDNTALGLNALLSDTTGYFNTAVGSQALLSNTTGGNNIAIGAQALFSNQTAYSNVAIGYQALYINLEGSNNTAIGTEALAGNFGDNNIGIGAFAGQFIEGGSNNIEIGAMGKPSDHGDIRIGTKGLHNTVHIAGIYGRTVPQGVAVVTDNLGHLGTVTSSARYKEAIKPMDKASETILALKPVTFRYKHEVDPDGIPQFGLVAEQVEKVDPVLVARDEQGKPYTVRYEAVNAMLLNEFLKEHGKVEALQATVAQQQSINAEQQKQIEALTASLKEQGSQIQKVSARTEMTRPAPKVVVNEP